jgi:hypothetical protein
MIAAVLALAASVAALVGFVFWQGTELRSLRKSEREAREKANDLKILNAAAKVAVADKEKAMNLLEVERENLTDALEKVKRQRDELLTKSLKDGDPRTVADAVRGALERLRDS